MKFPLLLSLLAFLLLGRAPLTAADTIEIKQHWSPGKKYYQTMQTVQESQFQIASQKMEQTTNMTIELTMTVTAAANGQPKRLTLRYERMAMAMSMNGQKMGYDSAHPDAGTDPLGLGKTVGSTVGQELKMVLNDKDEIVDIENYDDFIKHLAPAGAPGMDTAKMFSKQSLSQMLKQGSLQALPEKPVAPGATWNYHNQIEMPQLGKVSVAGEYTLKSVGDHNGVKCAEIAADGTLTMDMSDPGEKASPLSGLGMKVNGGTIKGTVWFDPQLGIARDSQLVQEMTIAMKNPSDPTGTIVIPMKQNISVTLTKVEDVK